MKLPVPQAHPACARLASSPSAMHARRCWALLHPMSASLWVKAPNSSFLLMKPCDATGMAQGFGSLPPHVGDWVEILPPGFHLAQLWPLGHLGSETMESTTLPSPPASRTNIVF